MVTVVFSDRNGGLLTVLNRKKKVLFTGREGSDDADREQKGVDAVASDELQEILDQAELRRRSLFDDMQETEDSD